MLLILFLENSFKLFLCKSLIINDIIIIHNKSFKMDEISKKNEGFIGFFDWLRISEENIVGIRVYFFDDLAYTACLLERSYAKGVFNNRSIEILFKGDSFDFNLSGDQDFTENYVYKSDTGEYLIMFRLDHLTENEFHSLSEFCEVINEDAVKNN